MQHDKSLSELKEIENILQKYIHSDLKYLDEFQHYEVGIDDKIHFHIRGYFSNSMNLPIRTITLDEYKDRGTGKPLPNEIKKTILAVVDKIEREKNRLNEIRLIKQKNILGDKFWDEVIKNSKSDRTKKNAKHLDDDLIKHFLEIAIPKGAVPKWKDLIEFASVSTWSKRMQSEIFVATLLKRLNKKLDNSSLTANYKDKIIRLKLELEVIANDIINKQIMNTKEEYPEKSDYREVPYPKDDRFSQYKVNRNQRRAKQFNEQFDDQTDRISIEDFDDIGLS